MAKLGSWSTTAGNNNTTPPDGWPEGQAPSTVNDCAREMMAAIKTAVNSLEYIDLNNTPSYLTATTFSMATADVANFEVGRRIKLFDATTLYGTIISVSTTSVEVRLDSGALTSSLSSVAMGIVKVSNNSLPTNVWKQKNFVINGNMDVWQRSASFTSVATDAYTADRFMWLQSASCAVNISRSERSAILSNVPSIAQAGLLLNSMLISVSAADATIASADYVALSYRLEGDDWRMLAHQPMNLSFWANTNRSGVYACSFRNGASSVSYVQNFTISTVQTWQKFSIPVPPAPSSPYSWDYSANTGLQVTWAFAAGGNRQAIAGEWTAMDAIATSSQVNFVGSAGNTFAITGIRLEEGQWASPIEVRPYREELALCSRYYQTWPYNHGSMSAQVIGRIVSTSLAHIPIPFEVNMRATPTVTIPSLGAWTAWGINGTSSDTITAASALSIGSNGFVLQIQTYINQWINGYAAILYISGTATAVVRLDSEL